MGFLTPSYFPYDPSQNASDKVLRTAFVHFAPFVSKSLEGDRVMVGGPLRVFVDTIQALVGRRIVAVLAEDIQFGVRQENGTFTGLMGMIQREEIDILLGPCIMLTERLSLAEPLVLDITSYRLLAWPPSKVVDPFNFISVFTFDVWALILFSMLLLGTVFWAMERFFTPWRDEPKSTLPFSLWSVFIRLFPQNPTRNQDDWYRVCMVTFLMTYSVVLMNFLNSQLTSAMSIKGNEDYINSFEDILRFPDVGIFGERGSSLSRIFTNPSNELYRKLRTRLIEVRGVIKHGPTLLDMIRQIEAKKRVIMGNPQMCQAVIMSGLKLTGKCARVQTTTESSGTMIGFMLSSYRLSTTLRGQIRSAALTTREASLYQKLIGFTTRTAEKCEAQMKTTAAEDIKPLMLQDLQGSFIVLAIGIAVSLIGLLKEMIEEFRRKRAEKKGTANDSKVPT